MSDESASPSPSSSAAIETQMNGGDPSVLAPLSLPPRAVYASEQALFDAIQAHAKLTGQCFVKLRSTTHNNRKTVTYGCDRSKKPTTTDSNRQRKRREPSKRTDCHFSVLGVELNHDAGWEVRHRAEQFCSHNHPPSSDPSLHTGHRKLNHEELLKVQELQASGVHPRQAVDILRQTINPDLLPHDVYNLFSSIRRMRTAGESSDNTSAIRKRRSEGGGSTRLEQSLRGFTGSPGGPFMDGGRNPMMPEISQPRHPPVFPGNIMTQPLTTIKYREAMTTSGYGNEHSVIEVRNLGGNALVGTDIWGGRDAESRNNRFQPILFSAKISLRNTFDSAAQIDKLNDSTVNYSLLSKAILKLLTSRGTDRKDPKRWKGLERDWSIYDLLNWAFLCLTGRWINGGAPEAAITHDYIKGGVPCLEDGSRFQRSLLNGEALQELELTLFLPKGTLLSGGVSLTVSGGFLPGPQTYLSAPYRSTLKIQDIQIPTLIGLNPNERTAKQMVIATVEIDPYLVTGTDYYNELEQIITKSMEESSFETLESLATHLSKRIIKHWIFPYTSKEPFANVKISLVKPSATTFADAPVVTITRSSNPAADGTAKTLWEEWLSWNTGVETRLPFPHQGRFDSWIYDNFPGDTTGIAQ